MDQAINSLFMRQLGIYNPNDHEHDEVHLIGAGGIGSFTAVGLARLGVPKITVYDPDKVEEHNVPNQNYTLADVGRYKTDAIVSAMAAINPHGTYTGVADSIPSDDVQLKGLVISGVDSMEARHNIWHDAIKMRPQIELYIDARLSGLYMLAYAANPTSMIDIDEYEKTLHSDDEGEDVSCTERGIIDVGLQIGSMLTRLTRRHFNQESVNRINIMNQDSYVTTQGAWLQ